MMLLMGIAFELAMLCILIYVPFLNSVFSTAPIGLREWAFLLIEPVLIILLDELRKAILRKKDKDIKNKK